MAEVGVRRADDGSIVFTAILPASELEGLLLQPVPGEQTQEPAPDAGTGATDQTPPQADNGQQTEATAATADGESAPTTPPAA